MQLIKREHSSTQKELEFIKHALKYYSEAYEKVYFLLERGVSPHFIIPRLSGFVPGHMGEQSAYADDQPRTLISEYHIHPAIQS